MHWLKTYNTPMRKQPDVLIVGGGVIGLTTAFFLALDGALVQILDRSSFGTEASWAGAGIIPPGNPKGASTSYDQLRAISSSRFASLSVQLHDLTGIDNGYRVCGGIEVFDTGDDPTPQLWQAEGIDFQELSTRDQAEFEPQARLVGGAVYYLPRMAQLRNPWHLEALVGACRSLGVIMDQGRGLAEFRTSGDRVDAVLCEDGTRLQAGRFLIAAGAWSGRLLGWLGVHTGVHPVKGQIVLFRSPKLLIRRIIGFDKRYLVPRDDGRILAGSTEEPEAGFDKEPSKSGVSELVRFATSVVPSLQDTEIEKAWAGLRPGSQNGLPFLGQIGQWRNAFVATGHFRAGIQLSPGTAEVMTDLLQGRPPAIPLDDFRIDRPRTTSFIPAFRS